MAPRRVHFGKWALPVVLVLVVAGVLGLRAYASHTRTMSDADTARAAQQPIPVRTVQVSSGPVTTVVGATAVTIPYEKVMLRIGPALRFRERNPVVRSVLAQDGTRVTPGQVVIELDTTQFELAVEEQKYALAAAESHLAHAQAAVQQNELLRAAALQNATDEVKFRMAAVDYTKEEYERLDRLYATEVAAISERLKAATSYADAEAELAQTRVREERAKTDTILGPLQDEADVKKWSSAVESAKVDLGLAEADLRGCFFRSPLDGYVTEMRVAPGQPIDDDAVLGFVSRIDPMLVQLDYPQERSDDVAIGQTAEVVLDSFPKETFTGKVTRIPVHVNTASRTVPVIVEVPNPNHRIKVGVSGYVRVQVARPATTAPAVAVIEGPSRAMAFVVADGRVRIRPVITGPIVDNGVVEILDGLKQGDEVVIYGQQDLRDNDRVDTDWRRWARRD